MTIEIPLTQGYVALVDDRDREGPVTPARLVGGV